MNSKILNVSKAKGKFISKTFQKQSLQLALKLGLHSSHYSI